MSNRKQLIVAVGCCLVILASAIFVYYTQFKRPAFNVPVHQAIGEALAEQTARLIKGNDKIVIITLDEANYPELRVQLDSFHKTLKERGQFRIHETYKIETDGKASYGPGSGLSSRRFLRIANKNVSADAIVSFVGMPELSQEEIAQLPPKPKLIVETMAPSKLKPLFEKKLLHAAVASRFTFPAPEIPKPKTPREWFDKQFQIVTRTNAATLPDPAE